MKAKILQGLPGSGKSTFAKEFCEKNPDWVRINRDDLRNMRGKYWLPKDEDLITTWERSLIKEAIKHDKNVVIDSTNLNPGHLDSLKMWLENVGIEIEMATGFLGVSPEQCIINDLKRPNSVGAKVIWNMYDNYLRDKTGIVKYIEGLPMAIIVDIDGTLAINESGRSPFDWNRVGEDNINKNIKSLITSVTYDDESNTYIILMSGRDSVCRNVTENWLDKNDMPYDYLWMRPNGDNRKDTVIKRELFDQYVRGKYNIRFVLDDRDSVVQMWRKDLGLTCLQVNYGDF